MTSCFLRKNKGRPSRAFQISEPPARPQSRKPAPQSLLLAQPACLLSTGPQPGHPLKEWRVTFGTLALRQTGARASAFGLRAALLPLSPSQPCWRFTRGEAASSPRSRAAPPPKRQEPAAVQGAARGRELGPCAGSLPLLQQALRSFPSASVSHQRFTNGLDHRERPTPRRQGMRRPGLLGPSQQTGILPPIQHAAPQCCFPDPRPTARKGCVTQ